MRLLHPPVAKLSPFAPPGGLDPAEIFGLAFLIDLAATLTTLIGLERDLQELERIAAALRRGSDAISRNLSDAALAADESWRRAGKPPALKACRAGGEARFSAGQAGGQPPVRRGPADAGLPAMQNLKHSDALAELKAEFKARLPR